MTGVLTERLVAAVDHLASVEHRHGLGIPIIIFINRHFALCQPTVATVLRLWVTLNVEEPTLLSAHAFAVTPQAESIWCAHARFFDDPEGEFPLCRSATRAGEFGLPKILARTLVAIGASGGSLERSHVIASDLGG